MLPRLREYLLVHHLSVAGARIARTPVYDYDPNLWAILEDGAFIGTVSSEGGVSFPILDEAAGLVPTHGVTLTDLRALQRGVIIPNVSG